jgi:hypothetical protein
MMIFALARGKGVLIAGRLSLQAAVGRSGICLS